MKKSIIVVAIIAVCTFIGVLVFSANVQETVLIKPEYRDIKSEIELSGKVQSKDIFAVKNTESAKIKYVYVKVGDTVKKGDTLYTLDDGGLEDQLEQLKSAQTASASASLGASEVLKIAQSGMSYEEFNAAIEKAKASQATQASSSTGIQISTQIAQIEKQLEAKKVKSEIDGIVVSLSAKKGQVVLVGEQSATIENVDNKYVIAYVMQQDYNNITEGMTVTLKDEQTGLNISGTVTYKDYIAKETMDADAASQYKIEIEPSENIKNAIGSNVSVFVCIEKRENTLSVPLSCVLKNGDTAYVYIKENGEIKKQDIETGLRDDDYIEVLRGIDENTSIVSDPSKYEKEAD